MTVIESFEWNSETFSFAEDCSLVLKVTQLRRRIENFSGYLHPPQIPPLAKTVMFLLPFRVISFFYFSELLIS